MNPRTLIQRPFRSRPLSGAEAGWFRPAFAVIFALIFLPGLSLLIVLLGGPTISGPAKDGSSYTLSEHIGIILGLLSISPLVTWMIAPVGLLVLRAVAMLGWAGWGTAALASIMFGLPFAHLILNGDLTTDEFALPLHLAVAIALLGLSIWATFWVSIWLHPKKERGPGN